MTKKNRKAPAKKAVAILKTATKKKVTVILFPGNLLKVIDLDDGSDDDHKDNPENTVIECRTPKGLERIDFHYKGAQGDDGAPVLKLTEKEVEGSADALAYTAWCYGPCKPDGMSCGAGLRPNCKTNGDLECI